MVYSWTEEEEVRPKVIVGGRKPKAQKRPEYPPFSPIDYTVGTVIEYKGYYWEVDYLAGSKKLVTWKRTYEGRGWVIR